MSKQDYEQAAGTAHHERDEEDLGGESVWETIAYIALAAGITVIILATLFGG